MRSHAMSVTADFDAEHGGRPLRPAVQRQSHHAARPQAHRAARSEIDRRAAHRRPFARSSGWTRSAPGWSTSCERDRGATIVGATEEQQLLIDHVTQADQPVKMKRDYESPLERVLGQVGVATKIALGTHVRPARLLRRAADLDWATSSAIPRRFRLNADHPAIRGGRRPRARHHRPDELPGRHRHRPAGRGPAAPVRRRGLSRST